MNRRSLLLAAFAATLAAAAHADRPVAHRVLAQSKGHVAILNAKGEVEWEVPCGHNSHDIAALPGGNFLIHTAPNRVVEMTPAKEVVWEWVGKPVAPYSGPIEIHAFQRLKNGLTLISECGNRRLIEVDKAGNIVKSVALTVERPDSHRDTRRVRKLDNGNYLVCHEGMGLVREYDADGKPVWEHQLDMNGQPPSGGLDGHGVNVFNALRLKNGNTLIGGGSNNRVYEVTPDNKIVWSVERDELKTPAGKPIHFCWITSIQRLPNGNTVINNSFAGPENPQMVEITRDKKVVWMLDDWKTFGNDMCASWLLDVKGNVIR